MLLLPRKPGFLVDFVKSPPNRVLTHDLLHPQQGRIDRITSQRRDVRIASVAGQHRQSTVPRTSRLLGAFGLVKCIGQPATQPSNTPPCFRYSMKNGNWPSGVTVAEPSHST